MGQPATSQRPIHRRPETRAASISLGAAPDRIGSRFICRPPARRRSGHAPRRSAAPACAPRRHGRTSGCRSGRGPEWRRGFRNCRGWPPRRRGATASWSAPEASRSPAGERVSPAPPAHGRPRVGRSRPEPRVCDQGSDRPSQGRSPRAGSQGRGSGCGSQSCPWRTCREPSGRWRGRGRCRTRKQHGPPEPRRRPRRHPAAQAGPAEGGWVQRSGSSEGLSQYPGDHMKHYNITQARS